MRRLQKCFLYRKMPHLGHILLLFFRNDVPHMSKRLLRRYAIVLQMYIDFAMLQLCAVYALRIFFCIAVLQPGE